MQVLEFKEDMYLCSQSYPQPPVDSVDKCLTRLKQGLFLGDNFGIIFG